MDAQVFLFCFVLFHFFFSHTQNRVWKWIESLICLVCCFVLQLSECRMWGTLGSMFADMLCIQYNSTEVRNLQPVAGTCLPSACCCT